MSTTYFYNRDTAFTLDEGSAASPSLSFAGDSDTGLYSGGTANVIRIGVGGSEKARFSVNGLSVYTGNLYIESGYKLNFDLNVSNNYYLQKSSTTLYMHSPVNLSLQTNGNHRLYINQSGNVGIGTTSPSEKLDVRNGTLTVRDDSNVNYVEIDRFAGITLKGNGTAHKTIQTPNTDALAFGTNNTERMRITADGNVAIGTTTSSYKLTVQGINNGINLSGSAAYLRWNSGDMQIKNEGSYKMGFHTYNTAASALVNRMVIDTDGNVGIGTETPDATLTVQSDTADSTVFAIDGVNGRLFSVDDSLSDSLFSVNTIAGLPVIEAFADNTVVMGAYNQNNFVISDNKIGIGTDAPDEILHIHNPAAGGLASFAAFTNETSGLTQEFLVGINEYEEALLWNENNKSIVFATNNGERMRILNNGNVGIGTTSPDSKLEINTASTSDIVLNANDRLKVQGNGTMTWGSSADYGQLSWDTGYALVRGQSGKGLKLQTNSSSTVMTLTTGGNVGIGTTSPGYKLEVIGTTRIDGALTIADTSTAASYIYLLSSTSGESEIRMGDTDTDAGSIAYNNANNYMAFRANAAERLRIRSNGNIGINTTSPSAKLHVVGDNVGSTSGDEALLSIIRGARHSLEFKHIRTADATDWNSTTYRLQNKVDTTNMQSIDFATDSGFNRHVDINTASNAFNTRFTHNGRVGIGTTNPLQKLQVAGSIYANGGDLYVDGNRGLYAVGNLIFKGHNGSNYFEGMRLTSTGNVGINTTNPSYKLQVAGTGFFTDARFGLDGGDRIVISRRGDNNVAVESFAAELFLSSGYNGISFEGSANTTLMKLTDGGNVGIGTTSPNTNLHIAGPNQNASEATVRIGGVPSYGNNVSRLELAENLSGADMSYGFSFTADGASTNNLLIRNHSNNIAGNVAISVDRISGNVGIGTTSPGSSLHVAGPIGIAPTGNGVHLGMYNSTYGTIQLNGSAGGYIDFGVSGVDWSGRILYDNGSSYMRFDTNSSERMRITSTGNVGIGTSSPSQKLHVDGRVMISSSSTSPGIQFQDVGTTNAYIDLVNGSQRFDFKNDATTTMSLALNTGRVGIGTTNPAAKLDIAGGGAANTEKVIVSGDDAIIRLGGAGTNGPHGLQFGYDTAIGGDGMSMYYRTGPQHIVFEDSTSTSGTGLMVISRFGNVGIGTTSPNAKLEVYGSGGTVLDIQGSQGQLFSVTDSLTGSLMSVNDISGLPILEVFDTDKVVMGEFGSNALVVSGSKVGIGTNTPANKLTVDGVIEAINSNGPSHFLARFDSTYFTNYTTDSVRFDGTGQSYSFIQNGSTRMRIDSAGNVGIGTTSPTYKLDVSGNARVTSTLDVTGNIGTAGNITASGYIGSNTSQTRDKLRVWSSGQYAIGMKSGFTFGPIQNNYAMSFQMNNDNARGFWWGDESHTDAQGAMALSTRGYLTVAERIRVGYGQSDTADTPAQALDVSGNAVISNAVSIGTTAIAAKLTIEGDGSLNSNFKFKQTGSQEHFLYASTNTQNNLIGSSTPKWVWGQQGGADRMVLDNNALLPGTNPGFFIGSDARRWEIIFCNILDSAGLHEKNLENPEGERQVGEYATGTVLVWKGGKNVPCTVEADHMRMGVAVEEMNSPLVQGAEPVLVTGIANEGDYLITSEKEGHARAISREEMLERNLFDCVLGKALESGNGESYLLRVWITI